MAVEPSAVMLAQRQPGAAPAVRATAEALPFGATMGVLTVIQVPIPADCTDGFNAAYWRDPYRVVVARP